MEYRLQSMYKSYGKAGRNRIDPVSIIFHTPWFVPTPV